MNKLYGEVFSPGTTIQDDILGSYLEIFIWFRFLDTLLSRQLCVC